MVGADGFRWLGTRLLVSVAPLPCSAWEARPGMQAPAPRPPPWASPGLSEAWGSIFSAFVMDLCLVRTFNLKAHLLPGPSVRRVPLARSSLRCLSDIFNVNTEVFILLKSRAYLNTKTTYIKSLILWSR